jgi:hypothetical protein
MLLMPCLKDFLLLSFRTLPLAGLESQVALPSGVSTFFHVTMAYFNLLDLVTQGNAHFHRGDLEKV